MFRPSQGLLLLSAWLAAACNQSSIRDVPRLDPSAVQTPKLPGIAPRSLMLRVEDERREDLREHSTELVARLDEAVRTILTRAGVKVADGANVLTIGVHEPERGLVGVAPQRCVELDGRLDLSGQAWTEAQGIACFEYRNAFGLVLGGNISQAYENALGILFRGLDQSLERLPRPPPAGPDSWASAWSAP